MSEIVYWYKDKNGATHGYYTEATARLAGQQNYATENGACCKNRFHGTLHEKEFFEDENDILEL